MLYIFPLMTLVFGYTMPSGVILYWFVFSLFALIQQLLINKKLPVLSRSKKGAATSNE
jgi:YidC/Oxa1 family membrane protein insertase